VRKLGCGSYSTLWLVKDQRLDRYASLKIATANSSKDTSACQVLFHLGLKREGGKIPPGNEFVLEMLDEFEIRGPNGTHRCIVSELLGPSLATVLEETDGCRLPSDIYRKVAAQVAQGVAFLHACGIFHGGALLSHLINRSPTNFETADLHEGNILFCIPGMDLWSEEEVHNHFGEPYLFNIGCRDGRPSAPHAPEYAVIPWIRKRCSRFA
jgi:serine/threonine-protein kinase SRPK3